MRLEGGYFQDLYTKSMAARREILEPPPMTRFDSTEIVIDPGVRKLVRSLQKVFENYDPQTDNDDTKEVISPRATFQFRINFGATMEDDAELFMLISKEKNENIYAKLNRGEKISMGHTFNAIARCGITTVGDLRDLSIEALLSHPDNPAAKQRLSARTLIFAQTAFKRFEQTQ
jgi:hypothetical protein